MSAALDDEADAFELRRMLDETAGNDELREEWHRLNLMRDIMREDVKVYRPQLRDAIWKELLADPEGSSADDSIPSLAEVPTGTPRKPGSSSWLGGLTGLGVAAGVALLVMFNGGVFEAAPQGDGFAGAEISPVGPGSDNLVPVLYPQATAADRQRQNGLMLRHIQQNAMTANGVTSFAKMATFEGSPETPAEGASPADSVAVDPQEGAVDNKVEENAPEQP